jgi:dCMP deaminase
MNRIDRTEYYFKVVDAVALRATCDRGQSGAILVRDGRIISTGYVGAPAKMPHCDEAGHDIETRKILVDDPKGVGGKSWVETSHCVRTVHAEMNALIQAAKFGPPVIAATMYCTMFPCFECAKAIVNAGIVEVFARYDYQRSRRSKELFDSVGVRWSIQNPRTMDYEEPKT